MVSTRSADGKLPQPNNPFHKKLGQKKAPQGKGEDTFNVPSDPSPKKPAQKNNASKRKREAATEAEPASKKRGRKPKDPKHNSTTALPNKSVNAKGKRGAKARSQALVASDGGIQAGKVKKVAAREKPGRGQGEENAIGEGLRGNEEGQPPKGNSVENHHVEPTDQQPDDEETSGVDEAPDLLQDSLFGSYHIWKRVRDSTRKLAKLVVEEELRIKTNEAKTINKKADQLCTWYEYHDVQENSTPDAAEEQERKKYHVSLEKATRTFRNCDDKERDVFRDFYAFVVPSYVDVLHFAIKCRSGAWAEEAVLPELREVLSLFHTFVTLCSSFRALSNRVKWSGVAIKKPTLEVIYPACRKLEKNLLDAYRRQRLQQGYMKKNLDAAAEEVKSMQEAAKEAHRRKIEERRRATAASIEPFSGDRKPTYNEIPTREQSPPTPRSTSNSGWTDAQDNTLLIMLGHWSDLSNNERYDKCLLCEELQNKSRELIRERALVYKRVFEIYYGDKGVEVEPWVASIS